MPRKNRATKQETLELLNQNLHKSLVKDQRHEKLLILNEKTLFGRDGTNIERRKKHQETNNQKLPLKWGQPSQRIRPHRIAIVC